MASGKTSAGAKVLESLKFWTVVAVLCVIVGSAAYFFGRDYVGEHLHEMEVQQSAPTIQPQPGARPVAAGEDTSSDPPVEPMVSVREREPSSREERRARRELEEPQDGAQLNAALAAEEDDEEIDDAPEDAGQTEDETSSEDDEGYAVVAGSFADDANAQQQIQRLAERGYQPFITTYERDGITYRRVNVGTFSTREEADGVEEELSSEGFDAAVWSGG